jgi:hypothetical protein
MKRSKNTRVSSRNGSHNRNDVKMEEDGLSEKTTTLDAVANALDSLGKNITSSIHTYD